MNKQSKAINSEVSFFTSFTFMVLSIGVLFVVLKVLAPGGEPRFFTSHDPSQSISLTENTKASPTASKASSLNSGTSTSASKREGAGTSSSSFGSNGSSDGSGELGSEGSNGGGESQAAAGDPSDMMAEAFTLVDKGEPHKAMAILEKVLAQDSKNEQALVELGMIHLIDLQDTQAALPYLEKAFQLNSDNKVVLSELIGIYDESGQPDAGLNFLQSLHDEKPDNPTIAAGIGQLLSEQNRLHEAEPYWDKAANNPQNDQAEVAFTELGEIQQRTGQLDKALNSYQQAAAKVQQKYDDGFYSHDDEMGKEELVAAHLNVVKVLISQNRQREAQELIDTKLKNLYNGNLAELSKKIESSNMLFGYK